MTSPPAVKQLAGTATTRPRWHGGVNEMLLSACSLVAALAACFVLAGLPAEDGSVVSARESLPTSVEFSPVTVKARPSPYSEFRLPANVHSDFSSEFHGVATRVGMSFPLFLVSFLLARVNVSSATHWHDLSPIQNLCVPILVTAYAVLGCGLLVSPGLFVLLFGSFPLIADLEHWSAFGRAFAEPDRTSILTPYWLRVYGVGALTSASWCIILAIALRMRPTMTYRLFHPSDDNTSSAIARTAAQFAAGTLVLCGLMLLYGSRLAEGPSPGSVKPTDRLPQSR